MGIARHSDVISSCGTGAVACGVIRSHTDAKTPCHSRIYTFADLLRAPGHVTRAGPRGSTRTYLIDELKRSAIKSLQEAPHPTSVADMKAQPIMSTLTVATSTTHAGASHANMSHAGESQDGANHSLEPSKSSESQMATTRASFVQRWLTTLTLAGAFLGVFAGTLCNAYLLEDAGCEAAEPHDLVKVIAFPGQIWVRALKLMVVPMIFSSMVVSVSAVGKLGSTNEMAGLAINLLRRDGAAHVPPPPRQLPPRRG